MQRVRSIRHRFKNDVVVLHDLESVAVIGLLRTMILKDFEGIILQIKTIQHRRLMSPFQLQPLFLLSFPLLPPPPPQ